jgi:hypothetical protein
MVGITLKIIRVFYMLPISGYDIGTRYYEGDNGLEDKVLRKLFLGFIHIHILHHAKEHPIFGVWMHNELKEHGYDISSYPLPYPTPYGGGENFSKRK